MQMSKRIVRVRVLFKRSSRRLNATIPFLSFSLGCRKWRFSPYFHSHLEELTNCNLHCDGWKCARASVSSLSHASGSWPTLRRKWNSRRLRECFSRSFIFSLILVTFFFSYWAKHRWTSEYKIVNIFNICLT